VPSQGDRGKFGDLNLWVGALIGVGVSALFLLVVFKTLTLTSAAPVSANPTAGTEGYDAFARSVQVVGLVTPVLTTILGFYFGVRAGAGGREAAESRAERAESTAQAVVSDATLNYASTQRALTTLKERLSDDPKVQSVLEDVRQENPRAFEVDHWLRSLSNLPRGSSEQ
jgi:hypothetical protein